MDQAGQDEAPSPVDPWAAAAPPAAVREPPLRLAWPPAVLVAALIGVYALQAAAADPSLYIGRFGFIPAAMLEGGWVTVVTALFVHGGWGHVLINSGFAIAFGSPVARRLGTGPLGGFLFFLFFLVCGVAGNLGYALVHPNGQDPVVGASGGIAALLAATSRLLVRPAPGRSPGLAPLNSPPVVTMGVALITLNVVVGVFHIGGGLGGDGAPVAWEAHVAGYLAGLVLFDLFDMAAGRGRPARAAPRSPPRKD